MRPLEEQERPHARYGCEAFPFLYLYVQQYQDLLSR
jgi:hypothetical protein